jgi:hypothetical protein
MLSGDDLTIVLFLIGTAISIALTAMSVAGWRHPVFVNSLFGLAGVCCVAGVAWPLLKTDSPAATAIVSQVATNPVAWFVVLILAIIASLLRPKGDEQTWRAIKPEKVFVNVSPSYLIGLYKNRTTIQGDDLATAYIGKWIHCTVTVGDIIRESYALVAQTYDSDAKFISASFSVKKSENFSHIGPGETITVCGEIASVNSLYIRLVKCELAPR